MVELDVSNVRELEDFLINDCMYAVSVLLPSISSFFPMQKTLLTIYNQSILQGIVRGKLDQLKRCFEVCCLSLNPSALL